MEQDLSRAINFRDLGGIATIDGRRVREGLLFRCAALGDLAPAHRDAMAGLNIRSIVDLRYNSERQASPTGWQDLGCHSYICEDYEPSRGGDLSGLLTDDSMTAASSHALMVRAYPDLAFSHVSILRRLFRELLERKGPVLFHCTSGKDRTGIAAGLILSALDVPRDAIMDDYLASLRFDILASPAFRDMPPERAEAFQPLYRVHQDYLGAMFDAVDERFGSVDAFLSEELQVRATERAALREFLLE